MIGVYQCTECEQYYIKPEEAEKELSVCFDTKNITMVILQCECGCEYGVGFEYEDFHEHKSLGKNVKPGVFAFDFNVEDMKDENLKTFKAEMLVETTKTDEPEIELSDLVDGLEKTTYFKRKIKQPMRVSY
jgi:hypothetical protein